MAQLTSRLARARWLRPLARVANAALNALDPLVVRRWRRSAREPDAAIPPRALRARVGDPAVGKWVPGGSRVARELDAILDSAGRPLAGFDSICDFGCGSGRVLTQIRPAPGTRLHGMDVDQDAIRWLRGHGSGVDARVNPPHGPAPFASDSFDLIFSISIFTHLNESSQRLWLAELSRLLRPGGLGLLTVLSEDLRRLWAAGARPGIDERQRRELIAAPTLASAGFIFAPERRNRWNEWRYRGVEPDYGLAFWDHRALRATWAEWFQVLDVIPGSINWRQDAVLVTSRG
jgi:SAM-dependent methyltransferase